MDPDRLHRLQELTGRHLDDELDPAGHDELAGLLEADGEARRVFARSVAIDQALPRVVVRRGALRRWWPTVAISASAALLAVGIGLWSLRAGSGPQLVPGDAVVVREGRQLPSASAGRLRTGDAVRAGAQPAVLSWSDEGSRLELAPGGELRLDRAGPDKALVLAGGRIVVEAGPQTGDRHLRVGTDRLSAEVVGTRFTVSADAAGSTLAVEHGTVAVTAGTVQRRVAAGELAVASATAPLWVAPVAAAARTAPGLRIDADAWRAAGGAEWIGTVDGDALTARVEATAERVQPPQRLAGYAWLNPDLRVTADIELARPATLAVILVCRRPDGSDWIGNYSLKAVLPAGRHRRSWTIADALLEQGAPLSAAIGARIVTAAVCAWNQPSGLVVHRVAVGNASAAP